MKTSFRHRFTGAAFVAFRYDFSSKLTLGLALLALSLAVSASASAQTAQWVKQMGPAASVTVSAAMRPATRMPRALSAIPGCSITSRFPVTFRMFSWRNTTPAATSSGPTSVAASYSTRETMSRRMRNGNSYVVGAIQTNSLHPTAQFGNITLTGNGDYDWLIVKYDTRGKVLWAKNYGSTLGDIAQGVALDARATSTSLASSAAP